MNVNTIPILLMLIFGLVSTSLYSQDATFTQWENIPTYINPALTGDFKGRLRVQGKYRNQYYSLLGSAAFNTGIASVDYKFDTETTREISVGFYSLFDRAGSSKLTTRTYNITTSVVERLGASDDAHHDIGIGFELGLGNRSLGEDDLRWPGGTPLNLRFSRTYLNLSTGLIWKYSAISRFSFDLGVALHNINQPNISLVGDHSELSHRYNIHGIVEAPISKSISIEPSFLFVKQNAHEQLLFGLGSKFYFKDFDANSLRLGLYTKTNQVLDGTELGVYVLSATLELNAILIGFSVDRFVNAKSNAYEFSVAHRLMGKNNN